MVQVLPDYSAQLGQDLGSIVTSLQRMWKPDWELQQGMKKLLATNPKLAQELANLESTSPGTLERLGLGPVAQTLSVVQPDLATTMQSLIRPDVLQAVSQNRDLIATQTATGKTPDQIAAGQLAGQQAQLGLGTLQNNPEAARQAGMQAASGMTSGQAVKNAFDEKTYTKALGMLQDGPEVMLSKVIRGEYKNDELNAIMATPMGEALKFQLQEYQERNRLRIAQTQHGQERGDAYARFREGKAFEFMMRTGTTDFDTAYNYLYGKDEKSGKSYSDMAAEWSQQNPTQLTPEQKNLVDAHRGLESVRIDITGKQDVRRQSRLHSAKLDFSNAQKAFNATLDENSELSGKRGEEVRELNASLMNDALKEIYLETGKKFTVTYEKVARRFSPDKFELVYRDATGDIVQNPEEIWRGIDDKPQGETTQSPSANPTQTQGTAPPSGNNKGNAAPQNTMSGAEAGNPQQEDRLVNDMAGKLAGAVLSSPANARISKVVEVRNKVNNPRKKAAYNRMIEQLKKSDPSLTKTLENLVIP